MYKRQQLSTLSFCIPSLYGRAKVSLNEIVQAFQSTLDILKMSTHATQLLAEDRASIQRLRLFPSNRGLDFNKTFLRNQLKLDQ